MQFKKNTPVYTADLQQVGTVDRVVLDPHNNEVSHLVIRHGWLFAEDKVAPIELIERADAEQIQLRSDVKHLDDLPPFEEVSYIPYGDTSEGDTIQGAAANTGEPAAHPPVTTASATSTPADEPDDSTTTTTYTTVTDAFALYGYPAVGMAWPDYHLGYYGYPDELYKVKVKRHIPTGNVALKEGATVLDSQEERVGTVKRVFTNDTSGQATHLLIAEGWLFKEERVIPLDWVATITDEEVHLHVKTELLKRLPAYQPEHVQA